MTIAEKLSECYESNTPIFVDGICAVMAAYSKPRVYQFIAEAIDNGSLARFDNGVYYLPQKTILGASKLDPVDVIEKKYIADNKNVYGFYSGILLLNSMGLTTQVPTVIEIVTNNEATRRREICIGNQRVILRKSRTEITEDNVNAFVVLELFNQLELSKMDSNVGMNGVVDYIKKNGLTAKQLMQCAGGFPARAMKNMVESGVLYEIA